MFAGAAREAVFSNPDVIKRVNADFIPIALKAALVNNPPDDGEGRLYREIGRSKIVPQGICVVNPACKVLDWALMFDDDKSVLAFLDHAYKRFEKFPDAANPVAAERYMKFPSQRGPDVEDSGKALTILERHVKGTHCPAGAPPPEGTLTARLFGRALDKDGKPVADTVRQESYVEDRFHVPPDFQQKLAETLAGAGKDRAALPEALVRPFVAHAYLGMLDVSPIDNPGRSKGELKECKFTAQLIKKGVWRIEGESDALNGAEMANAGPGDMHEVKLTWHGFVETSGKNVTRVVLSAQGTEKLRFNSARGKIDNEVAFLPAGRRIDFSGAVRYGFVAEPAEHPASAKKR